PAGQRRTGRGQLHGFGRRASSPGASGQVAARRRSVVARGRFAMTGQAQQPGAETLAGPEQLPHLPPARTGPLTAPDGVAVAEQPVLSFGGLLRQLRTQARLTQEELAEAARLSPRSVSDLERGISRTARKDTAGLLAEALSLTGPV